MELYYDNLPVHALGEFTVTQAREYEGGDAPQRGKVTLKFGVTTFARRYADNYSLLQRLAAALKKQHAVLRWRNPEADSDYVNRTVTLVSSELPEEWGEYEQTLNFSVMFYEHDLATQNLPCTFRRAGASQSLPLGNVLKFAEAGATERFSKLRSHRAVTTAKCSVSGLILGDVTTPLSTRRPALTAQAAAFRDQMNGAEGVLTLGTAGAVFNRTVRVEDFTFDIDQLINAISYSFTASYTLFPNEADYATVEFTVEQRDPQTGEQSLVITGKISAPLEAAAETKLAEIMETLLAEYGYDAGSQQLRLDKTPVRVSANGDGDAFIELSFTGEWRRWLSENRAATFKRTGAAGAAVDLGHVRTCNFRYTARRFDEARSQRQHAAGAIELTGTWAADRNKTQAQRRADLDAAYQRLLTQVNGADGLLRFPALPGGQQTVRIEDFRAELNQGITGVDWSLTAVFSLFPNETNYATCEFTIETRANVEEGEDYLAFTGRIQAPEAATATAKLTALRDSLLASYAFAAAQVLRSQNSFSHVGAESGAAGGPRTPDATAGLSEPGGVTFIELTFSEEYRKRSASILSSTWQCTARDDIATGLVQTTYSGSVTAGGASADAAYLAALGRAVTLGANKETLIGGKAFLRAAQTTWERRRTQDSNAEEFVRLTFSYEYQSKMAAGRCYLEVNTQTVSDRFGADSENVNGFVVAVDAATAEAAYQAQVRAAYAARLVRNESKSVLRVRNQGGVATVTGTFNEQELRLEFSFAAHSPKAAGKHAIRYALATTTDLLNNDLTLNYRGSVFAASADAAETALTTLFTALGAATLGLPVARERNVDLDFVPDETVAAAFPTGQFMKLDFSETYRVRASLLTSVSGILEMRLTEEIIHSGTRFVPQPLPFNDDGSGGITIVQPAGIQEGQRTVRGTVTAVSLATAETWAKQQRALLTGSYKLPERWERDYEFAPRVAGVVAGDTANVKLHRVNFTFAEILPDYPAPA